VEDAGAEAMPNEDFTYTFKDKSEREITIVVDDESGGSPITAHFEGKKIGEFVVWQDEDGFPLFKFSDVDNGFQCSGIGTEMLRRAFEYHGRMRAPNPDPTNNENPMTTAGHALMTRGVKEGWILPMWEKPEEEEPS
jgi:hypothetical protein